MQSNIKVALLQHSCCDSIEQNQNKCLEMAHRAANKGAQLIVMQELHQSLYFCQTEDSQNFDLAETIPGKTSEAYAQFSKQHQLVLVCSLFEKRTNGIYHNTAVVFDKGKLAGRYRKMHIPDDPGYYEKYYFTPGDQGFLPIETSLGKLVILICWDQWFPEAARAMALAGADILIFPTAIGWDSADNIEEQQRQLQAWSTVQRSHAITNGLPVIAVNRVGYEKDPRQESSGITFWGNSFACGPQGEILIQGSESEEDLYLVEIDLQRSESVRRIWPYLRDRRIDAYDSLLLRFNDGTGKKA